MKLTTLGSGSRDDQLAVVLRNLKTAHFATYTAGTLQRAPDDWIFHAPQLQDLYNQLNAGRVRHPFVFNTANYMVPLPCAYQWASGPACLNYVELVRKACGVEMPLEFWTDPLMYQGGSDDLAGICGPIVCHSETFSIDFEARVAVITGDVPTGTGVAAAAEGVRLIVLANDMSLCNPAPAESGKGFGFLQGKSVMSFSPVAVMPDELGDA